jgi:hypothetical protein
VVQSGQEARELPAGTIPVDQADDFEQRYPRHEPGDQEHGVGAAGNDVGQERDPWCARERGQHVNLTRQAKRGRTRPGKFHDEPER